MHAFVVGGTGMLRPVSVALADRFDAVSVIARTPERLLAIERERPGKIEGHALDWGDAAAVEKAVLSASERHGPIDLAVVWAHDDAPEAPLSVARGMAPSGVYVHVLGSDAADPSGPKRSMRLRMEEIGAFSYREAILGFVRDGSRSRWLRNEEIAQGVLGAIDASSPRVIVGTVEPWNARP